MAHYPLCIQHLTGTQCAGVMWFETELVEAQNVEGWGKWSVCYPTSHTSRHSPSHTEPGQETVKSEDSMNRRPKYFHTKEKQNGVYIKNDM